jgi:hypothetical protein
MCYIDGQKNKYSVIESNVILIANKELKKLKADVSDVLGVVTPSS